MEKRENDNIETDRTRERLQKWVQVETQRVSQIERERTYNERQYGVMDTGRHQQKKRERDIDREGGGILLERVKMLTRKDRGKVMNTSKERELIHTGREREM